MKSARATPEICHRCKQPIRRAHPGDRARFCQAPACKLAREKVLAAAYRENKRQEAAGHCRFCPKPRAPGREVCGTHTVLKQRCACGGLIPRRDGPGRQAEICPACDLKKPPSLRRQRQQPEEEAHGT